MKIQNVPLTGRGAYALILLAMATSQVEAVVKTYRYFKFEPTKLRTSAANSASMSEFQFKLGATVLPMGSVTVTNPGGNTPAGEAPPFVKDGLTTTKWLDFNKKPLVFDFGVATGIDSYNYATSGDATERDPVSWLLYGSDDNLTFTPIDIRNNQTITTTRQTYQAGWSLPENVPPFILQYASSKTVAINGSTNVTLNWETLATDSVTITNLPGTLPPKSAAPVPLTLVDNADTVYTLTATSPQGTANASATIRTVAGGSKAFSYVRFTPVKLRDDANANSVQISEFFFRNGVTQIPIISAFNDTGGTSPAAEGPEKIFDNLTSTKWLNLNKGAIIMELSDGDPENVIPVTFDSYGFTTPNDAEARDPVRWILEGANDFGGPWTLLDNLTAFDFQTPTVRFTSTQDIPLPGVSIVPFATLSGETKVVAGEPITLVWNTSGASTVTISGIGPVAASGSQDVFPVADTTYTLSATSGGPVVTAEVVVDVITPAITQIDYDNFDGSGDELALLGQASVLNDFALRPAPGDANRLRLTPDAGSATGGAWFRKRVDLSDGFESDFALHFVNIGATGGAGADGMAFVIHNDPRRTQAFPALTQENGLPTAALNITFDSFLNGGEPSAAGLIVREGTAILAAVNLGDFPRIKLGGTAAAPDLTQTSGSAAPYRVRVAYLPPMGEAPGDLDIYVDGELVVNSLAVDLDPTTGIGAVDATGKGYVGFTARTGGAFEAHDVTSWSLTEGPPAPPLRIVSSTVTTGATPTATLSWSSGGPHTYKITTSTDLVDWSNVVASGIVPDVDGENTITVNLPVAAGIFVRVEEE